ncbi:MAG: c-type cytochrome [Fidelibacterota bacterium]|nr:MAG: c-type cytochrome [Candidatus Neomarinimicrobiota bacterium]
MKSLLVIMSLTVALLSLGLGQKSNAYQNLQVLPQDIPREQLSSLMKGFTQALGVRCSFCHVGEGDDLSTYDFPSDKKPSKAQARVMLGMVDHINREFLPNVAHDEYHSPEVTCMTCHRGKVNPEY